MTQHLRSKLHAGETVKCMGCDRTFPTISAMTIHLESGICPSGATRQKVNNAIRLHDRNNLITERLLTYPDSTGRTEVWATSAAWNGHAFECYFCDREFRSLRSLNQHLQSPVHEQKLYHCPKCAVKFNLFSGLVQHVESESCGIARFTQVKNAMDLITSKLQRTIAY
jgi:Zinc-finger of C2H2 type